MRFFAYSKRCSQTSNKEQVREQTIKPLKQISMNLVQEYDDKKVLYINDA